MSKKSKKPNNQKIVKINQKYKESQKKFKKVKKGGKSKKEKYFALSRSSPSTSKVLIVMKSRSFFRDHHLQIIQKGKKSLVLGLVIAVAISIESLAILWARAIKPFHIFSDLGLKPFSLIESYL